MIVVENKNYTFTGCASIVDKYQEYRQKVVGTHIDQRSLLSTDYFNNFNSVMMVPDLLPDAPELLEEVEQWQFHDYIAHFQRSGLDFAPLTIEAYPMHRLIYATRSNIK